MKSLQEAQELKQLFETLKSSYLFGQTKEVIYHALHQHGHNDHQANHVHLKHDAAMQSTYLLNTIPIMFMSQ